MSEKQTQNEHIKALAIEVCEIEGRECWIVPHPMRGNTHMRGLCGLNGYAVYPKRPLREQGYGGVVTYVPVHGGITYAEEDALGMVYGFDTGHCDSDSFPLEDPDWIKEQLSYMIRGIAVAAEVEAEYLLASTNEEKAALCDRICKAQPEQWRNMGTMINLLCGRL